LRGMTGKTKKPESNTKYDLFYHLVKTQQGKVCSEGRRPRRKGKNKESSANFLCAQALGPTQKVRKDNQKGKETKGIQNAFHNRSRGWGEQ